jgi:hypothetical protein
VISVIGWGRVAANVKQRGNISGSREREGLPVLDRTLALPQFNFLRWKMGFNSTLVMDKTDYLGHFGKQHGGLGCLFVVVKWTRETRPKEGKVETNKKKKAGISSPRTRNVASRAVAFKHGPEIEKHKIISIL